MAEPLRMDVRGRLALGLSIAVGIAVGTLILRRTRWIVGSEFWHWPYQTDPSGLGWTLLAGLIAASLVAIAWRWAPRSENAIPWTSLSVLIAAAVVLRLSTAWLFAEEVSLRYIDYVVRNPLVGSYYTVAERVEGQSDLLRQWPGWMPHMPPHAMNKPPGPSLWSLAILKWFGPHASLPVAAIVGLSCGAVSLLCIPLLFTFVRTIGGSCRAALHAATLWSLVPGAAIFFPLFDPLLTAFTLGLTLLWIVALQRDLLRWSIAFGVLLAVTIFFSFHVLVIAPVLAVAGWIVLRGSWRARSRGFAKHAAVALGVAIALHGLLALATGFNLFAVLRVALENQKYLLTTVNRPYPQTIGWDLLDFTLGAGWMPMVLAATWITRMRRPIGAMEWVVIAGLGEILIVAATGLLPGETARVWNFLLPLLIVPAALELDRSPGRTAAIAVYALLALVTALVARSLVFMFAG